MPQHICALAYLVDDYDRAIQWFVGMLGFALLEDTAMTPDKRWVRVGPVQTTGPTLILAKAATPEQSAAIGKQAGGRVFLFLQTDDFARDYAAMRARGVVFRETPRHEPYGTVAVFEDLYGQGWDLIEMR